LDEQNCQILDKRPHKSKLLLALEMLGSLKAEVVALSNAVTVGVNVSLNKHVTWHSRCSDLLSILRVVTEGALGVPEACSIPFQVDEDRSSLQRPSSPL
jgi:hypothetical protein